jgi:hypothetical protein
MTWPQIRDLLLQERPEYAMVGKKPIKPVTLQNGYNAWLRAKRGDG